VRAHRLAKLEELRRQGIHPYPNDFRPTHTTAEVHRRYGGREDLEGLEERVRVAGRMMAFRDFGRAVFSHLQDGQGRIQIHVRRDVVGPEQFDRFKRLVDVGDILGVEGVPFRTRTGELTIRVEQLRLLAKALRDLPEKWHGLTDVEARYRRRYLDLMANPEVRDLFKTRARIIQYLREFLTRRGFVEVETPVLQPLAGGAAARPFRTFHHALQTEMYLRIAPELYLKRLLVGGLDRVFELGKSFRNEGVDSLHNPEFTMLEFYQAYATYEDLMHLTEEMIAGVAREVLGTTALGQLELRPPWRRISLRDALLAEGVPPSALHDREEALRIARGLGVALEGDEPLGKLLVEIFERVVEPKLIQPTFVTHWPVEVSPLARRFDHDPNVVERFELFMLGREVANAFSELNDPLDQRERFLQQAARGGQVGEDFLQALEHGMPPAAGEGIGVDRLVMTLTGRHSIREVMLFPQLRPQR